MDPWQSQYLARLVSVDLLEPLPSEVYGPWMESLVATERNEPPTWRVRMAVCSTEDARDAWLGYGCPHSYVDFDVRLGTMHAGDEFMEAALDLYHWHERPDDLSPPLRQAWAFAWFADQMTYTLLRAGVFNLRGCDPESPRWE